MEYFDFSQDTLLEYRSNVGKRYNKNANAAKWYYDTRNKFSYLLNKINDKLGLNFKTVYHEKPNGQAGRGKISFKDYVLCGFSDRPKGNDDLFIKFEVSNLIDSPNFAINLDLNFRKKSSPFQAKRNEIFNDSYKYWKLDDTFPKNYDDLINLISPSLLELYEKFNYYWDELEQKSTFLENQKGLQLINNTLMNQILYGPPGTGKTYHTINKAVAIANPTFDLSLSRDIIKAEYKRLVEAGQIVFTTFHQSMSYEDFVEGIKPLKPLPNDTFVKYEVVSGIFKNICRAAETSLELIKTVNKSKRPFDEVFEKLKLEWEENSDLKFPLKTAGYDYTILGFTNTSIQFKKASGGTGHTLSIKTLEDLYYGKEYDFKQGVGIYYPSILNKLESFNIGYETDIKEEQKYVLIIDEINRGNVSAIFGELITLLEDSKREGKPEALEVTLPYSKEKFSVPSNLYIIGTMNTADRSVEALDTALRRRFVFEEMLPNPDLKELDYEVYGYKASAILKRINLRIEKLVDRDHCIGHAYFIDKNEETIIDSFYKNIIPLLQEYFFGDYGKIGLVLGKGFIRLKQIEPALFADFRYEYKEDLESKTVYEIIDYRNGKVDVDGFREAIVALMNNG